MVSEPWLTLQAVWTTIIKRLEVGEAVREEQEPGYLALRAVIREGIP